MLMNHESLIFVELLSSSGLLLILEANRKNMTHINKRHLASLLTVLMLALFFSTTQAQQKEYTISAIGFYNMENLFDTLDSKDTWDTEFTPKGPNLYTAAVYKDKLKNLSKVVSELGTDYTPDGLAILGVSEIENRSVLEDFVKQPTIKDRNYQIVHYDSPDFRGIDVALLYNPKYFEVIESRPLHVELIEPDGDTITTRDILYVSGKFAGEEMHIFVNHWSSRRGGEKASQYKREKAASVCREVIDQLREKNPKVKVIVMGDLNDDPVSPSVKVVLASNGKKERTNKREFFNPMEKPFKQGIGSNAWRDAWSLFDQVLVSHAFVDESADGFKFYKSVIYNKKYMIQKSGRYKGYPYRAYSGGSYMGGYSDHFPVFVYLIREKQ
jgi:hypothetical protein